MDALPEVVQQFILLITAIVANTFSALAGGGAGLVQFPILIFLGLTFSVALATHKIASVALGIGATARHLKEGTVQWPFLLVIIMSGIPGVLLGANIILIVPDRTAEIALGLMTLCLGLYSIVKPSLGQTSEAKSQTGWPFIFGCIGLFIIGVLNGSLASGTGLFCTLLLVRWFGFDYQLAVAYTLIAVGLVWNASGALALSLLGDVQWSWLPPLIIGALIGGYLGAHLAIKKGNRWIKIAFETVTILVSVKLLIG